MQLSHNGNQTYIQNMLEEAALEGPAKPLVLLENDVVEAVSRAVLPDHHHFVPLVERHPDKCVEIGVGDVP